MTTFKWHATTPLTVEGAQDFWEVRYRHGVTPWDRGQVNPALINWLDSDLNAPCRILVPGCGRGYEVIELAGLGFDVTAVDLSPLVMSELEQSLADAGLSAELIVADLMNWSPANPFDAAYEQTCLCALLPAQRAAYARRLAEWVRPAGRLYSLFMQTDRPGGPPFHCPLEEMHNLFPSDLWDWPRSAPETVPHSSGFHELATILERR